MRTCCGKPFCPCLLSSGRGALGRGLRPQHQFSSRVSTAKPETLAVSFQCHPGVSQLESLRSSLNCAAGSSWTSCADQPLWVAFRESSAVGNAETPAILHLTEMEPQTSKQPSPQQVANALRIATCAYSVRHVLEEDGFSVGNL